MVKCDRPNRPEAVDMKISDEDGVSVTVATGAAAVGTSQGRRIPRRDRDRSRPRRDRRAMCLEDYITVFFVSKKQCSA